jgi:hypothetical protein
MAGVIPGRAGRVGSNGTMVHPDDCKSGSTRSRRVCPSDSLRGMGAYLSTGPSQRQPPKGRWKGSYPGLDSAR